MTRRLLMTAMVLSMAVLLVTTYKAFAEEEFTREQKIEFLKMGLIVNGGDTTRWGPVDLTRRNEPPPKIVQSVPIAPDPVPVAKPKPAAADICARHGKRKVVKGSSWRCR